MMVFHDALFLPPLICNTFKEDLFQTGFSFFVRRPFHRILTPLRRFSPSPKADFFL